MTEVVLIYPFFRPSHDRSIFRFPPLGLGYIASYLRMKGISVEIIDCTFISEKEALAKARRMNPSIVGVYSMYTMEENSLRFARSLRDNCDLLVAGGPLPSTYPERFLQDFDIVVIGEGEQTMLEIATSSDQEGNLSKISGIAYSKTATNRNQDSTENNNHIVYNPPRPLIIDLDSIPPPARDLFDNESYKKYYKTTFRYATTSIMTSRGCPFRCDFCSKPVFGDSHRARSAERVVDEIEDALSYGYGRVFFQDDCFTLDEERTVKICDEILKRKLRLGWECLSRVDIIKPDVLSKMRQAGCKRIFFGIESGNNSILKVMNKQFTIEQARKAVESTASSGIKTGAFFIIGYPGETDDTVLDTVRFATSLPLDYLSFTLPYPIPGTGLYKKEKNHMKNPASEMAKRRSLIDHKLNFQSSFPENKLKFAIIKAMVQFRIKKHFGGHIYFIFGKPFDASTDLVFKILPNTPMKLDPIDIRFKNT